LQVHPIAQRKLVPAHVKRLSDALDLDAVGALDVVEQRGKYWIVDGQHRWAAMMSHGLGEWKVRCELHVDAKTDADACWLFLKLNDTARVHVYDKFRNKVVAGDPVAVKTNRVVESLGLEVSPSKGTGRVRSISSLQRLCAADDGESLAATLGILHEAFGDSSEAFDGSLIDGLGRLMVKYNGEIDRAALVRRLSKYPGGSAGIIGDARGMARFNGGTLGVCAAEVIAGTYNRRRGSKTQLVI